MGPAALQRAALQRRNEQSVWFITLSSSGTEGAGGEKAGVLVTRKRQCRIKAVKCSMSVCHLRLLRSYLGSEGADHLPE